MPPQFMRTQEEIQTDMTELIRELAKQKPSDSTITLDVAFSFFPDLKSRWNALIAEAEELRSKGFWKSQR
jgi:chorismate mutase